MKKIRRVVGGVIIAAEVDDMGVGARFQEGLYRSLIQASVIVRHALRLMGPFDLDGSFAFHPSGCKMEILDVSDNRGAIFHQDEFNCLLQRAHYSYANAIHRGAGDHVLEAVQSFSAAEGFDQSNVEVLFRAMTSHPNAAVVTAGGEHIAMGVDGISAKKDVSVMDIQVGSVTDWVRYDTSDGPVDLPVDAAPDVQVGQRVRFEMVEQSSGTSCVRVDRIGGTDTTGDLFRDTDEEAHDGKS